MGFWELFDFSVAICWLFLRATSLLSQIVCIFTHIEIMILSSTSILRKNAVPENPKLILKTFEDLV